MGREMPAPMRFTLDIPPPEPELQAMIERLRADLAARERAALGGLADLPLMFPGQYKITREFREEQVDGRPVLFMTSTVRPIELVSFGGDVVARDRITGEYV